MKIAVSADCFASFTSGFPVRGMMLELIKLNPEIQFQLYYTLRPWPENLADFYDEINSQPNVEVRYFKDSRKVIALKRLLGLKYVEFDNDVACFLNPGNPEYIRGFHGPTICSLADLSTIKGISTNRHALFFKYWGRVTWEYILPTFSKIVTISDYTKRDVIEIFPKVKNKLITIHNGISTIWFDESCEASDGQLERLGVPRSYFIWWGFVSRRKNISNLIAAYKKARKSNPDLPKLLLVGAIADHMSEIKKELDDDIVNIPFQNDAVLKSLVKNSRGLIFPSWYEGFGLPVIEAFSQGVNVACSDITSLPEVAGGHAILFDPASIDEMVDAIIRLSRHESKSQVLIDYARQFSYRRAAENYMRIIKEIAV